jgi:kynurenine formamidase
MMAIVCSVSPELSENGDRIIKAAQLEKVLSELNGIKTLIIRTLPNDNAKLSRQYSNTNPPYFEAEAIQKIVDSGIEHLLVDLPSVDREEDAGALIGHHIFWNYPENPRKNCSITELIYVPEAVEDGLYFLQLGIAAFENDAAPSRPLIYPIVEI